MGLVCHPYKRGSTGGSRVSTTLFSQINKKPNQYAQFNPFLFVTHKSPGNLTIILTTRLYFHNHPKRRLLFAFPFDKFETLQLLNQSMP